MLSSLASISSKVRLTKQLRLVLQVLFSSTDHPTVDEIYSRAYFMTRGISKATVYRNVRKLVEQGIVEKHDFGFGRFHYEISRDHHHHIIDVVSKKVFDFTSSELEDLKEKIAREMGFKLISHRLDMYGVPLNYVGDESNGQ